MRAKFIVGMERYTTKRTNWLVCGSLCRAAYMHMTDMSSQVMNGFETFRTMRTLDGLFVKMTAHVAVMHTFQ